MKTSGLILAQLLVVYASLGQKLDEKFIHDLPDSVMFSTTAWADADNDGLLDVIAFAENVRGETVCYILKNEGFNGLVFANHIDTRTADASWLITDIDGDNLVDLLLSGYVDGQPQTSQFLNRADFAFERSSVVDVAGSVIRMADFNQDGLDEIMISGQAHDEPFLRIYQRGSDIWTSVHDSISISAESIEVLDFDADGRNDFLLSGIDAAGAKVTRIYLNDEGYHFIGHDISPAVAGTTADTDLNGDGDFDILLSGEDASGQSTLLALHNDGSGTFTPEDTLNALTDAAIFAGDLDSDGWGNINLLGLNEAGDTINFTAGTPDVIIPHKKVISQAWGDGERDGDLDLLQLRKTQTGYSLHVFENKTTAINFAPQRPTLPVIARIFDRLFIGWVKPTDDRTAIPSLTYDVFIQAAGRNLMAADFDLLTGRRLNVSHGNNGTADFVLLRGSDDDVFVAVQAVDNAFHAGPGSICVGSGQGRGLCSELTAVKLELCKNERVTLRDSPGTKWFSFKHGYLADTSDLVFDFHETDTIFSVARQAACATIGVYILYGAENLTRLIESTKYLCQNEVLRLGVEPGWSDVAWTNATGDFLSAEDTIAYTASAPDTIKVKTSDGNGCIVQRNIAINISKPSIATPNEAYQILKGEEIRLSVSGGISYAWTPSSDLDDPTSSSPLAKPRATTEYTVTARDSLNCIAMLHILVMVEETAFVPNLFTPNNDGKNDELKVYGLGDATSFSFTIFNREGIAVYATHNAADVVHQGWNGTSGGVDQPSGVYYWKVAGETVSGKEVQLNGKRSGSIVLLR